MCADVSSGNRTWLGCTWLGTWLGAFRGLRSDLEDHIADFGGSAPPPARGTMRSTTVLY